MTKTNDFINMASGIFNSLGRKQYKVSSVFDQDLKILVFSDFRCYFSSAMIVRQINIADFQLYKKSKIYWSQVY